MKLYISGKVTGLSPTEYTRAFADAERKLRNMGHKTINPIRVNRELPMDTEYEDYMKMSLLMVSFCEGIYMLSNYKDSPGAMRELARAKELGLEILYEGKEL